MESEAAKRKRQTQSCDRCKFKKRKCDGENPCGNCIKAGAECTMLIEQKKRGPKKHAGDSGSENVFEPSEPVQPQNTNIFASQNQNLIPDNYQYQGFSNLDFDTDFVLNLQQDPFSVPVYLQSQKKPQQTPLQIDPEVLNLYTQLNPKLTIQTDLDAFLSSTLQGHQDTSGPMNLMIPDLPGVPSSFFMHLISMFFTYYHPTFPVLQEHEFMSNLVPENKHHPMLLNTMYAIGCIYSRSAYLYQTPFYTPQKAFEYFVNRALNVTPPPEVWGSADSMAICQASLILCSADVKCMKSYSWMMVGMSIRLAMKFEMYNSQVEHDFFSVVSGVPKVQLGNTERQRVWWGAVMMDLFSCLATGSDLMIREDGYADSFVNPGHVKQFKNPFNANLPISFQSKLESNDGDRDKWMPFFSGFPTDTIFGASDINSTVWQKQSIGFFQIGHLMSNLNEYGYLIQLSLITRKAIRFAKSMGSSSSLGYLAKIVEKQDDMHSIHDAAVMWFENLPVELRMWNSLDVVLSSDVDAIHKQSVLGEGLRLSSTAVLINLLFFATLSILHQTRLKEKQKFKVSSFMSTAYDSRDMIKLGYRGVTYLLKRVYGQYMPPTMTFIPPSEIVGSGVISTLIVYVAIAMLSLNEHLTTLLSPKTNIPDASGIDSLESVILPCLDNFGQIWDVAYGHASHVRHVMEKIQQNNSGFVMHSEPFIDQQVQQQPVFEQRTEEKSWYDLRNEFEDEFLL